MRCKPESDASRQVMRRDAACDDQGAQSGAGRVLDCALEVEILIVAGRPEESGESPLFGHGVREIGDQGSGIALRKPFISCDQRLETTRIASERAVSGFAKSGTCADHGHP
jgi:hypothetical protein